MHNSEHRLQKKRQQVTIVLLLALLIVAWATPINARVEGVVHFFYFYDPGCSACEQVHREVLEPLLAEYGQQVIAEELDIADTASLEFLLRLEEQFKVTEPTIPEVFIGRDALIGADEIRARLKERIDYYLAQGGVALPAVPGVTSPQATATPECKECPEIHAAQQTAAASKQTPAMPVTPTSIAERPTIHVAYFYQPGCDVCERADRDLQYIVDKYPQVKVQRFNVKEEAALNQYLCSRAKVPVDKHLTAPALFVGDGYLLGNEISGHSIEALIQPYLESGAAEPWAGWEANKEAAQKTIIERFRSLSLLTVIGAGLLDGVNPCAFATMIFLISYLSVRKREGPELLATGAAFTAGVFLAYFGIGIGLLKFLAALPVLNVIGKWVYGITMVLCLGLAWGSFADYRKAREGRLEDMSLKLPERMRGWIRYLIREGSRARRFVLASVALGFVVALVELVCTGQVYLPTIVFVLGVPAWQTRATLALLVYNVMFVLPLIGVFLLVYYGTTSQQLTRWMNRRAAAVKLGTAVLFVLLAAWLGYSIITA